MSVIVLWSHYSEENGTDDVDEEAKEDDSFTDVTLQNDVKDDRHS